MANFPPVDEQLAYIKKGAAEIIHERELRERLENSLKTGKPMRVKAGFDPTAPDLHVGHTVLIRKLKHFQDLGHTVIFLIGDFTGMIGDPSGRSVTRPPLTRADIDRNAETYKSQVFKILDPRRRWSTSTRAGFEADAGRFYSSTAKFTVSQMLEREEFHKRFQEEKPITCMNSCIPSARDMIPWRSKPMLNWVAPTRNSTCSWARAAKGFRTAVTDHSDHADSGRHRRRAEDVKDVWELHRHQRAAAGDLRQGHVNF